MEDTRKSRVVSRVTVVRAERTVVPVRLVRDEFEEEKLQIGDEVVGWPVRGHAYPESMEFAEVELSDGRHWSLPAEEIPYETRTHVRVTSVSRQTIEISCNRGNGFVSYETSNGLTGWLSIAPEDLGIWAHRNVTVCLIGVAFNGVGHVEVACMNVPFLRCKQVAYVSWLYGHNFDYAQAYTTEVNDEFVSTIREHKLDPNGPGMTFARASALSTGDDFSVEREYAFWKADDGSVTNGKITFPKERPYDQEWRNHRDIGCAIKVTLGNWPTLLNAIVGCYYESVDTVDRVRERIECQKAKDRNRERIRLIVAGQCFDPGTFDENEDVEVGIRERLLFTGWRGGKRVCVVDSPNHGHALYVFGEDKVDVARAWAHGSINWQQAQREATSRIVHVDGWQERAAAAIN